MATDKTQGSRPAVRVSGPDDFDLERQRQASRRVVAGNTAAGLLERLGDYAHHYKQLTDAINQMWALSHHAEDVGRERDKAYEALRHLLHALGESVTGSVVEMFDLWIDEDAFAAEVVGYQVESHHMPKSPRDQKRAAS